MTTSSLVAAALTGVRVCGGRSSDRGYRVFVFLPRLRVIDAGVPPHELLNRRFIGRHIRAVRDGAGKRQSIREKTGSFTAEAWSAFDLKSQKILKVRSVVPIKRQ